MIAPEIFEMRVPRNLHPLILPSEIEDVVSNDITSSECSETASNLSVSTTQVQTDSSNLKQSYFIADETRDFRAYQSSQKISRVHRPFFDPPWS